MDRPSDLGPGEGQIVVASEPAVPGESGEAAAAEDKNILWRREQASFLKTSLEFMNNEESLTRLIAYVIIMEFQVPLQKQYLYLGSSRWRRRQEAMIRVIFWDFDITN